MSADRFFLGRAARNVESSPAYQPISGVTINAGEDANGNPRVFSAGNSNGRVIEVEHPWGSQAMAQNILSAIQGYAYKPFQADNAIIDPAAELGDAVTVDEIYSVIADVETELTPLMTSTISAPGDGAMDHEYPYLSPSDRALSRVAAQVGELRTSFTVENGKVESIIEQIGDPDVASDTTIFGQISSLTQTVGSISASVYTQEEIKDFAGSVVTTWASENITSKSITDLVSESFDKAGAAATAYADAKKYTDEQADVIAGDYITVIDQTAKDIKAVVAASEEKYDLTELPAGVEIDLFGYGNPNDIGLDASGDNAGDYYLDQSTGLYYRSNGTTWTPQTQTPLPLVTANLQSQITLNSDSITTLVTDNTNNSNRMTRIEQRANSINLSVLSVNGQTKFTLSDTSGELATQTLWLTVDSAYISGYLVANALASESTITAPYILGGYFADTLGQVGLTIGYSGYDIGSMTLRKINDWSTEYFEIYWSDYGVYLSLGGTSIGRFYNGVFYPLGNWDFSNASVTGLSS